MAKCSGITRAGTACKGIPIDGSQWCYVHHPNRVEERRRHGARGGKRGGRGRPLADLADLKHDVRGVIDGVLDGTILQGPGAVVLQGYNTLLRAAKVEMDIREQTELVERLEALERASEGQRGGRGWGA
ncbi:MAG: hypothetical protein M3R38_33290 [Actinomycetota bacterium]|nr:hypothetical protein [Actinomycetota bacterium]